MNQEWILAICGVLTLIIAAVAVILAIRNRRNVTRVVRTLGVCVFLMLMTGKWTMSCCGISSGNGMPG